MAEQPCMKPCGPYYEPEGDWCGLPEGHAGDCDPTAVGSLGVVR